MKFNELTFNQAELLLLGLNKLTPYSKQDVNDILEMTKELQEIMEKLKK